MVALIDLTGQKFKRLTVLSRAAKRPKMGSRWLCACDCGNRPVVSSYNLRSGITKSCGCWKKEVLVKKATKHGHAGTKEFRAWTHIRQRCYNKNSDDYKNYGGRGITVCESWMKSFSNFIADMGEAPSPEHTIERINNNASYSPENCKWDTRLVQCRNRRNVRRFLYKGRALTITELAPLLGLTYIALYKRIVKGTIELEAV